MTISNIPDPKAAKHVSVTRNASCSVLYVLNASTNTNKNVRAKIPIISWNNNMYSFYIFKGNIDNIDICTYEIILVCVCALNPLPPTTIPEAVPLRSSKCVAFRCKRSFEADTVLCSAATASRNSASCQRQRYHQVPWSIAVAS